MKRKLFKRNVRTSFIVLLFVSLFPPCLTSITYASHPDKNYTQNQPQFESNQTKSIARIAVCPQNPPYQFLNESGELKGINIDIMNYIAQKYHYNLIYITYDSYSACLDSVKNGMDDIALGYKMDLADTSGFYATSELSNATISVVSRKSIIPYLLETKKNDSFSTIYEYGSINLSLLYSMGFRHLLCASSQAKAFEMLLDQKADILVGSEECITYMLEQNGQDQNFETLYGMVSSISYTALVNKNSALLYRSINRALEDIRADGTYEAIYNTWVKSKSNERFETTIHYLSIGIAVSAFLAAVFSLISYVLRRKVAEKTSQLVEANRSLENVIEDLKNEASFRNDILDLLPVGAILFGPDYTIILMNPAAHTLCRAECQQSTTDVRDLPIFGDLLVKYSEHGNFQNLSSPNTYNIFSNGRDGKYRCWIYLRNNENHCPDTLMLVEDVTEEELHRQKLFSMEKYATLNQVTAGIAHEIKNPLMTIRTAVSLVESQWDNPEVRNAFTQFIPAEVDKIDAFVKSLLNYSKPPSEDFCVLEIVDLVKRSFYLAAVTNKSSKIDITFSVIANSNPYVKIQKDFFGQTLTNLLINAIWAVRAKAEANSTGNWKGTITGKIDADDKWVYITILDNGVGMSKYTENRCMEPFFTTKEAGTGLGLALAKQCIGKNSGTMSVESKESENTKINIRLPRIYPENT